MQQEVRSFSFATDEQVALQRVFIQNVYAWMTGGLLVTTLAAWATIASPVLFELSMSLRWILFIAMLGMVFYLSARIEDIQPSTAKALFLLYSALTGVTLSVLFFAYTAESLATVFVVTCGTFAATAVYGYTTNRDLSSVGSFMFMGLIGLIIASVVNIFLQSSALTFATSVVGVIVFVGLTAYDMQRIKELYAHVADSSDAATKYAIIAALALYLDFINLFLNLLRLLGRRR
ncbi:MAG: Bax inhibitor-1/YccA family protein [Bacteroidota bacterium]|nr:Bax inhibitor-1/YccA family protein [Candidatus Kapabacteria bacterium]MCS7303159.1 Bax inhibitor-1/YccA family protein [Candidatus Kapabacteria bacterium]MCX7937367.1 Bax inhibitor-1/YccA family protein [Chlorobiota bacterium]MDW8075856.1 Bax inhibitor-1/YccA family protein [Bacteroidota bacterium]MDW8271824.1 Bax inhibitor-1/YccA family protein [Bacteroidota bacterium]